MISQAVLKMIISDLANRFLTHHKYSMLFMSGLVRTYQT